MTYCLGIESTAHTFGASIVRISDKRILSNARRSYTTEEGGIVPTQLAEHHVACAPDVIRQALQDADVRIDDVSLLAYSRSPGMGHALRVGVGIARSLALRHDIPLVGVSHCVAHLDIGRVLGGIEDPVLLYVSGANTQVIARQAGAYRVFGETLDLGAGNFLDTIARMLGLGFPGGPKLERLAASYDGELIELPYSVKGMDVSLSGMQTKLANLIDRGARPDEIAFSVQETVFAMLVEVTERALAHTGKPGLVLGGGVACNQRLQEMCRQMCRQRDVSFFAPDKQYLVDNGAMIAILGIRAHAGGMSVAPDNADIDQYERTEEFSLRLQ